MGAVQLGNDAEALEMAGKREDFGFIEENHSKAMEEYKTIVDALSPQFKVEANLPEIPEEKLAEAYEAIGEFSAAMDYDCVNMVLDSVKEFSLPSQDKEKFDKINQLLLNMDWDGINDILKK